MDLSLFDTPLGWMGLAEEDGAIIRLYLPNAPTPRIMPHETPLLAEGRRQLMEYLAGARSAFDLPLRLQGTDFQRQVWEALRSIPYGETRSYGQLAAALGRPGACRAVGMANHNNPIPILVPCHRVVGANGSLTGYAGGLDLKQRLLELERSSAPDGRSV